MQAVVKQAAQQAGIQLELKAVVSSVFFSSDVGNPDTYGKFYADMQTYNWTNNSPDPEGLMQCFASWEVSSKANKWLGQNMVRWQKQRIRCAVSRCGDGTGSGQARRPLHPDERPARRRRLRAADRRPQLGAGLEPHLVAPLSGWDTTWRRCRTGIARPDEPPRSTSRRKGLLSGELSGTQKRPLLARNQTFVEGDATSSNNFKYELA